MKEKTDGERKGTERGKKDREEKEGREEKGQVKVKIKEMLKMEENKGKGQKTVTSNNIQHTYTEYDLGINVNVKVLYKDLYKKISKCTDQISKLPITAMQGSYLFCVFSVLAVLGAAVDIPPGIIDVGQVAWALLLLQLGQD